MFLTGKYDIIKKEKTISSFNNIQNDGFILIQQWFSDAFLSSSNYDVLNNDSINADTNFDAGDNYSNPGIIIKSGGVLKTNS